MNKGLRIILGALLVVTGVVGGLNAVGVMNTEFSLDGWWTLFIIIPCLNGLFFGREKVMSAVGVVFGVLLLLAARDLFDFTIVWRLIVPAIIVVIGIKLMCKGNCEKKVSVDKDNDENQGREEAAVFCSKEIDYTDEEITVSKIGAFFGGAKCNLSNAVIKDGSRIDVCCIFGGADIIVPENVNVKINTFCLFGGVADKRNIEISDTEKVTLNINGFCMFGGADIK